LVGYAYIWEFQVKPGSEAEFELHYGPDGTWVRLFRNSPDFIETLLLKDKAVAGRYITLDRWRNEAAWQAFQVAYAAQYAQLDKACENLTEKEQPLGSYAT